MGDMKQVVRYLEEVRNKLNERIAGLDPASMFPELGAHYDYDPDDPASREKEKKRIQSTPKPKPKPAPRKPSMRQMFPELGPHLDYKPKTDKAKTAKSKPAAKATQPAAAPTKTADKGCPEGYHMTFGKCQKIGGGESKAAAPSKPTKKKGFFGRIFGKKSAKTESIERRVRMLESRR